MVDQEELKRRVLVLSTGYGVSMVELADMLGINKQTLYNWRWKNGQRLGENLAKRLEELVEEMEKRVRAGRRG